MTAACVRFRQRYLARMSSKDIVVMIVVDEMGNHPGYRGPSGMIGVKGQIRTVCSSSPPFSPLIAEGMH